MKDNKNYLMLIGEYISTKSNKK